MTWIFKEKTMHILKLKTLLDYTSINLGNIIPIAPAVKAKSSHPGG